LYSVQTILVYTVATYKIRVRLKKCAN
jgi:hypothetical protein